MKPCRGCNAETCERFHQDEVYFPWCHGCPIEYAELFAKSDRGELTAGEVPIGATISDGGNGRWIDKRVTVTKRGPEHSFYEGPNDVCLTNGRFLTGNVGCALVSLPKSEPTPKPGDTVDPRTLPVGARFMHDVTSGVTFEVNAPGKCHKVGTSGAGSSNILPNSNAVLISLPQPIPAPTAAKRPPCDACGEESTCTLQLNALGSVAACDHCANNRGYSDFARDVRARRAKQTSAPTFDVPFLPTYDQIAGWLGAEWVMLHNDYVRPVPKEWAGSNNHPSPWWDHHGDGGRVFRCYLKHTPTGQRVEVTAPREAMSEARWQVWFGRIKEGDRGGSTLSTLHVRWLDPDTKTSGSMPRAEIDTYYEGAVRVIEPRWQTRDPARIAALEAKLAEQVRSGGQDGKSARWLLERADTLLREEEARSRYPLAASDATGREEAWGVDPFVQPGRRMSRFELPQDQRCDRKRTGR